MKRALLLIGIVLCKGSSVTAQDLPGLNYCLLFDSELEKHAFQTDKDDRDAIIFLLAYDAQIDSSRYTSVQDNISQFVCRLEMRKSKFKKEVDFLSFVFHKVHNEYLRHYNETNVFGGIFNGGSYNCVSGTALYAHIIKKLGYSPRVFETRYHIFLEVHLFDNSEVMFEATDPLSGFVSGEDTIQKRIQEYLQNEKKALQKNQSLSAPFNEDYILKEVSLVELSALHYYNLGVDLVNHENFYDAYRALKKANLLYPSSQRITDLLAFTCLKYDNELSTRFENKPTSQNE
jgi:hypothetical protein